MIKRYSNILYNISYITIEQLILTIFLLMISCTPKIGPIQPDIDNRPGKNEITVKCNEYDTLSIDGYIFIVEKETIK